MDRKVFVALDCDIKGAHSLLNKLDPKCCGVKIGKELFTYAGPEIIRYSRKLGYEVFLDLKFCDIPNTVAKACIAAASHDVFMITLHASGGKNMLHAAREAIDNVKGRKPLLLAVTVLTSLNQDDLELIGVSNNINDQILNLCKITKEEKIDGIVCSPLDLPYIKSVFEKDLLYVTPGVRTNTGTNADQKRVCTPTQAIENGSDYLVIGRPITESNNPIEALKKVNESILLATESMLI